MAESRVEEAFVRRLMEARAVSKEATHECQGLQAEMERAGLSVSLEEILLRRGLVTAGTLRSLGGRPVPPPLPASPEFEKNAERIALARGLLSAQEFESVRSFQTWAAGRGIRLGIAEILVRRQILPPEALSVPGANRSVGGAPAGGSRRVPTTGPRRTATARTRASGDRKARSSRPAGKLGLWIGLGAGGVLFLGIGLGLVLFGGGGTAPAADAPRAEKPHANPKLPPPSSGDPPAPEPSAVKEPPQDLDQEFSILQDRVSAHMRELHWDRARREIDAFEQAIPNDATRAAYAGRLANLRGLVDDQEKLARGEKLEGDAARSTPMHAVKRIEELNRLYLKARQERRFHEAMAHAEELIQIQPDNASFLLCRAKVHADLASFQEARRDADRAVELLEQGPYPASFQLSLLQFRADICNFLLDFDTAIQDLRRAIDLEPRNAESLNLLAQIYLTQGDFDRSLETMRKAATLPQERAGLYILFANQSLALMGKGLRSVALDSLRDGANVVNEPRELAALAACRALAWVHPACGEPDVAKARAILDAEAPMRGAVAIYVMAVHALVECLEGHLDRAYGMFTGLGERWTGFPEIGFYYARAARKMGREDEARAILDVAKKLRPQLAEALAGEG